MDTKSSIHEQLDAIAAASQGHRTANAKLLEAAGSIAEVIKGAVPAEVELPRGYVVEVYGNAQFGWFEHLALRCDCFDEESYGDPDCGCITGLVDCDRSGHVYDDFNQSYVRQTSRAVAMRFARDVEEGLLGEIAEFLRNRAGQTERAVAALVGVGGAL